MRSKVVLAMLTAFAAAFPVAGATAAFAAPHSAPSALSPAGTASPASAPAHRVPQWQRRIVRLEQGQGGGGGYWRCDERSVCLYDQRNGQGQRHEVRNCGYSLLYGFYNRTSSVWNRTGRYVDLWDRDPYRGWRYLGTVDRYDRGNLPGYLRNTVDAVDVNC